MDVFDIKLMKVPGHTSGELVKYKGLTINYGQYIGPIREDNYLSFTIVNPTNNHYTSCIFKDPTKSDSDYLRSFINAASNFIEREMAINVIASVPIIITPVNPCVNIM